MAGAMSFCARVEKQVRMHGKAIYIKLHNYHNIFPINTSPDWGGLSAG
jgi:hypothetical protein